ncbi:MAG: OmpA family protein [Proteobacteria bacterium]|nr:OmpA family protein [Pseudomonadota bacterium]
MKTPLILIGLLLAGACSKKPAAETPKATTPDTKPAPVGTKQDGPAPVIDKDQKVSPGLAVSADLLAVCGITAAASTTPTFDYDKDELTSEDRKVLDQIATCLMTGALKGKGISLIGRADARGTEEYNLSLGSRRGETVGAYLTRSGVQATQVVVTTRGALDATGTDDASMAQDRRVDIQMRNDGEAKAN